MAAELVAIIVKLLVPRVVSIGLRRTQIVAISETANSILV